MAHISLSRRLTSLPERSLMHSKVSLPSRCVRRPDENESLLRLARASTFSRSQEMKGSTLLCCEPNRCPRFAHTSFGCGLCLRPKEWVSRSRELTLHLVHRVFQLVNQGPSGVS